MPEPVRTELLTVRVTPAELAMLRTLAEADGVSASDVVRQFIRRTHASHVQATAPKKKAKRK